MVAGTFIYFFLLSRSTASRVICCDNCLDQANSRLLHHSRQAIKKYVTANNKLNVASQATFDAQFNKAIKAGVEKGEFTQPKGKFQSPLSVPRACICTQSQCVPVTALYSCRTVSPPYDWTSADASPGPSGPVKLAKKEAAAKPAAKPAAKATAKSTTTKTTAKVCI